MPIIDTVINRKANIVNVIFFIVLNLKNPAVVRFLHKRISDWVTVKPF